MNKVFRRFIDALLLLIVTLAFYQHSDNSHVAYGSDKAKKGIYYLKPLKETDKLFVEKVDTKRIVQTLLPGFRLTKERELWVWGKRLFFCRANDDANVEITISVYKSMKETGEFALSLLNDMSAVFKEGSPSSIQIGDSCWWHRLGNSEAIVFTRRNVLVYISGYGFDAVEKIAKALDVSIVGGTKGVRIGTAVLFPVIHRIEVNPKHPKVGEPVTVKIIASDPSKERLTFLCMSSGGEVLGKITSNTKTFRALQAGNYEIQAVVYNENSNISTAKILISVGSANPKEAKNERKANVTDEVESLLNLAEDETDEKIRSENIAKLKNIAMDLFGRQPSISSIKPNFEERKETTKYLNELERCIRRDKPLINAVAHLEEIGVSAIPVLTRVARDLKVKEEVRAEVIGVIGSIGSPIALEFLVDVLNTDSSQMVRDAAADSIEGIIKRKVK